MAENWSCRAMLVKISNVEFKKLVLIRLGSDTRSQEDSCDLHIR